MDYNNIATTVFTLLEYGSCGLSEERALEDYGEERVLVYHSTIVPLEWNYNLDQKDEGFIKLICDIGENKRIIGFHILAPNAGEITQGISIAMSAGITKDQIDNTVGIHPTIAEVK